MATGSHSARAVFLDLDGTLVDSEPHHFAAWRAALLEHDFALDWRTYANECVGHSDPAIAHRLSASLSRPAKVDSLLAEKHSHFVRRCDEQPVLDERVRALLIRYSHLPLALVTSSTRAEVDLMIDPRLQSRVFSAIVCQEDVRHTKPHPEPYLLARSRLAATGGTAFEDSEGGCASALAAGLDVVRVSGHEEFLRVATSLLAQMEEHSCPQEQRHGELEPRTLRRG